MKSIALVTALVAAGTTARAEVTARPAPAPETLRGVAMSGPYTSAFDDKCADLRGLALRAEASCTRVRSLRIGSLAAEIHRVGWDDGSGDYYLALHTGAGWFVSDLPLQIEVEDGHAGHYDVAKLDAMTVGEERVPGAHALSFQIRQSWVTYCGACDTEAERTTPVPAYDTSATLVCGWSDDKAPSCTAPLYTQGDAMRPPRVVAGKLVVRGALAGRESEDGQEWSDVADGDYAIAL